MKSLLVGCGYDRRKKVALASDQDWRGKLIRVDMNPRCEPDIICDLSKIPLPFADNEFDDIGAYDFLEHVGQQGDWRGYFDEMSEYHRILAPGGTFGILVPIGDDALADPGHTRFFGPNHFAFLNQKWYEGQIKDGHAVTDYRWYWKKNFDVVFMENVAGHHLAVMLRKDK